MMVRNVAVTLIIVKFLQSVNIVCGQNTSFIVNISSEITSSTEVVWSASTLSTFSLWKTSSSQILKTVNAKEINGTTSNFTAAMITGSESSKFQSKSFNHSAKSITSSSEYSANISFSASSSSNVLNSTYNFALPTEINTSSPVFSSPFTLINSSYTSILISLWGDSSTTATSTSHSHIYNFTLPTGINTSSPVFSAPFTLINSSHTPILISSWGDSSTTATSTNHASTSFASSSIVHRHLSELSTSIYLTTYSHSPTFSLSAKNSFSESLMTFTSSSTTFSLTSKMSFSRIAAAFSTRTFTGTKSTQNLNQTSSPVTSVKYLPSFSQTIFATSFLEPSSQHFPSATPSFTTVQSKSSNGTVIIVLSSDTSTMSIKTSEAMNSGKATKRKMFSSSTTKVTPSRSVNVLSNIRNFKEFHGKILVSVKYSLKNKYNSLKKVADSVESILDVALRMVSGYIYSKVLQITTKDNPSKFQCTFKIFVRQSSSETASTLQEKINKYNDTNGFGNFTLHSIETSAVRHPSSTEQKLYLWAIIVIGVLGSGVLCLFLLVAFVCIKLCYFQKKQKKLRKRQDCTERRTDIFHAVIDDTDESKNIPLKLLSVSSTESRKSMQFSDSASVESQPEGNGHEKKSAQSLPGESEGKDDETVTKNQSLPRNGTLQIHDDDHDKDQTDFSTFTKKR